MTNPPDPKRAARDGYIAGLRVLADLLEQHDELPTPYGGSEAPLTFMFFGAGDNRAKIAAAARLIPGKLTKKYDADAYFNLGGVLGGGLKIQLTATRDAVCERVVVGTKEVARQVPDAEALAKVPTTTVVETVEEVRWECSPLLSERVSA